MHGLIVAACRLLKLRCECSVVWVLDLSCCETSWISVPCLGMEPALEGGFLPTGPQGKSLHEVLSAGPQLPLLSSQPPRGNLITFLSLLSWFRAEILIAGVAHIFMHNLPLLLSSSAEPQPLFAILATRIRCPLCAGIYPRCSHVAAAGVGCPIRACGGHRSVSPTSHNSSYMP